jgi:hypothetical protein
MNNDQCKPAVRKNILYFLAGSMWTAAGFMLMSFSIRWSHLVKYSHLAALFTAGVLGGLIIHRFGFIKVAEKNINRLTALKDKPCIFSFMSWKSYLMVGVMMTMGFLIRHSGLSKEFLVPLYTAIGTALILSSTRYYRSFFQGLQNK